MTRSNAVLAATCAFLSLGLPACDSEEIGCRNCPDVAGTYRAEASGNGSECGFDYPLTETIAVAQDGGDLITEGEWDFEGTTKDDLGASFEAHGSVVGDSLHPTAFTIILVGQFTGGHDDRAFDGELRFNRSGAYPCDATASIHWTRVD